VTSATYDAANELTNWNGLALSYDQNGNMLSDGTNAFTWNSRNQVAKLNNISLQYDAFGRRIQNAAGTSFLYDGANAAQELSGGTVTANLLSGGVDEIFSRTDGSGLFTPLKDALGSTIALVDSGGNVQTSYTYDPYGGTSVTGTNSGNEFQYTGRENEGNGLYFYRARYYSPLLGRFISEDPLGFGGGGPNSYAYVSDNPILLRDPSGLCNDPDPLGQRKGLRYCVEAFIPDTHVGFTGFKGDGRGPQPDGGTFRFHQDVAGVPVPDTITSYAGISQWLNFGAEASMSKCGGSVKYLPKLHGRKIHLFCGASDGWFFGLAPNALYDLTILETPQGTFVSGDATSYPSIEVWQYGGSGGPKLVFYQNAQSSWFTELIFPRQSVGTTLTSW
jgi:RHS repeat-associated protein